MNNLYLLSLIYIITIVVSFVYFYFIPDAQPPDILLGARVTSSFKRNAKDIIRKYKLYEALIFLLSLSLYLVFISSYIAGTISLFLFIFLSFINLVYWRRVVISKRGELPVATRRIAIIEESDKRELLTFLPLALAWVLIVNVMLLLLIFLIPLLLVLTLMSVLLYLTPSTINPAYPEESFKAYKKFKTYVLLYLNYTAFITMLSISLISFSISHHLNNLVLLIDAFILISLLIIPIPLLFRVGIEGGRLIRSEVNNNILDDDKYWKGGIIYYNKDDPRIFVPKRNGFGYTLNFGNRWSYLILFIIILAIVIPIIFTLLVFQV